MPENAADEDRGFLRRQVQPYQSVARVAQAALKEMLVAREQGRLFEPVEERQDVIIADAFSRNVLSDHAAVHAPST